MNAYRTNIATAVKYFRPVLSRLRLRSKNSQSVYLAEFDHLEMLGLDHCIITVIYANLKTASGLFFCRKEGEIIECFIVLNDSLDIKKTKIAGVHEFCHALAILYTITLISTEELKDRLFDRLSKEIDELNTEALNKLYSALNSYKDKANVEDFEFPDSHFRLNCEGDTVDYSMLFRHLLFSKELFDETFTKNEREEFKNLMNSNNEQENNEGAVMYINKAKEIAKNKDVPERLAVSQAISWAKEYLK